MVCGLLSNTPLLDWCYYMSDIIGHIINKNIYLLYLHTRGKLNILRDHGKKLLFSGNVRMSGIFPKCDCVNYKSHDYYMNISDLN